MTARDHLNPVQFHATVNPAEFPATDWVHVGTRKAAQDRMRDVKAYVSSKPGRRAPKMGMVAARIRGPIALGKLTDQQAQPTAFGGLGLEGTPAAHPYVNEHEDPGSISHIVHKSKIKVVYRGPVQ